MKTFASLFGGAALAILTTPALAQTAPAPDGLTLKPLLDARLRYEDFDRTGPLTDGEATTLRVRLGAEARVGAWSVLAEGEGLTALGDDYNDGNNGNGVEPFAPISDPANLELNRLQLQYKTTPLTVTLGRQRILLDDQRFVGNSSWRQNEQTFDAVRAEGILGRVKFDLAYANSQRTVFGVDGGDRESYDGDFFLLGASVATGPVALKGFAYLVDHDEAIQFANSSDTYGLRATGTLPALSPIVFAATYAQQSDAGSNPIDYATDYLALDATTTVAGFGFNAGFERLGSDNGGAFQTPLAAFHKFAGWSDIINATPAQGLADIYVGVTRKFPATGGLPELTATMVWHDFDSTEGGLDYGDELDAQIGFKIGKLNVLAKYADYRAEAFATDARKIWLQLEWVL